MGVWTIARCNAGHVHRSTQQRLAHEAVTKCNVRTNNLMAERGWTYDDVCERCVQKALKGALTTVRSCPGCTAKVGAHFFPLSRKVCYACSEKEKI